MARKKLKRFAELPHLGNVLNNTLQLKGKWREEYFKNNHPLILELACGKGEYTIGLAQRFPRQNFIGVDVKGERIWRGATTALSLALSNAAFLQAQIERLTDFFEDGEVDEIWLPFPEPHPKRRKLKNRLTSPRFLNVYRKILRAGGSVHFKTDDGDLFHYSLETLQAERCSIRAVADDLYNSPIAESLPEIQTTYEKRHLAAGKTIKYVCFGLN